ncbi:MAG TPA: hypothetical protein VFY45_10290 [Baekduia sp.]|nr:hypothetical protein [Baekduia sp.]
MSHRRLTFPAVAVLAIASLALGVVAALADGRDGEKRGATPGRALSARATVVVTAPRPVPPTASIVVGSPSLRATVPVGACPADDKPPAAAPVPQNLLDAFGVLRRERADTDALPASALKALRQRGLEPFDIAAARLLRQTDGGRAWVIPVRDVSANVGLIFEMRCVARTLSRQRQALAQAMRERRRRRAPAVPPRASAPPATVPTPTRTAPLRVPAPAATVPTPVPVPAPDNTNKPVPHPGLAVVALDGAPVGAGGRLEDLVRGREPVAIDPCGGPNHDMLSVSGIVPDGVGAAFLTSPDGTAVRADVKDNAYAFVVPRTKQAEERYVVWTGGDGTPHVQPLGAPVFLGRARCPAAAAHQPPTVSPDGSGLCGRFYPTPAIIVGAPAASAPARRIPQATPPPLLYRAPCALAPQVARAIPVPPSVRIVPKARRAPKHHG